MDIIRKLQATDGLIAYIARRICEEHQFHLVHQMFASIQRIIHLCLT